MQLVIVQDIYVFLQLRYVIVWDNVSFHRAATVQNWIVDHPQFLLLYLPPPYSPFLNPIEELFSACRSKVYDRQPYERLTLLEAMEEACDDIDVSGYNTQDASSLDV